MTADTIASAIPLYRQLAQQISAEIRSSYQPGQLLPSEGTLTQRFGVNRHTLRRAIAEQKAAFLSNTPSRASGATVFSFS